MKMEALVYDMIMCDSYMEYEIICMLKSSVTASYVREREREV